MKGIELNAVLSERSRLFAAERDSDFPLSKHPQD